MFRSLLALVALAAAGAVFRAPHVAGALSLAALVGALAADWLPAAPPRLLALLPLGLATGLLLVRPSSRGDGDQPDSDVASSTDLSAGQQPGWARALGWVGVVLHVVAAFPYLVSGLVAPLYGIAFLWVLWAALLVVALRLRVQRPAWTPLVPVTAVALWQGVMLLGGALLGWQP